MSKENSTINMSFRVEKNLKKEADELFRSFGMNTSVALNMFLTQCVREKALPFIPHIVNTNEHNNNDKNKEVSYEK